MAAQHRLIEVELKTISQEYAKVKGTGGCVSLSALYGLENNRNIISSLPTCPRWAFSYLVAYPGMNQNFDKMRMVYENPQVLHVHK